MSNRIVKDDEKIAETIEKITNLMTEIDEIDITSNKLEGDKGQVHTAIVEGEEKIEALKTEMKGLFQATINFISGVQTSFEQRDEMAKDQIQTIQ